MTIQAIFHVFKPWGNFASRPTPRAEVTNTRKCSRRNFSPGREWTLPMRKFRRYCTGDASESFQEDAAMASELKEVDKLDRLIDAMLDCKNKMELAKVVVENVLSLKQNFWLRLAARADTKDASARKRLESLSRAVMTLTEEIVKMSETQLKDSSELVNKILVAAADERGHWDLPLSSDKLAALEQALRENKEHLGEAFLATVYAWMRKSSEDKIQGMVPLLQRVLQLYASLILQEENPDQTGTFVNNLMREDPSMWCSAVKAAAAAGILNEAEFNRFVQMKLERTIELPGGSYEQRVQVEFLTELKDQAEKAF